MLTPCQATHPAASQAPTPVPTTEGLVDATNRIVLNDLIPGAYRLTVTGDGYESLETTITVNEGTTPQDIIIAFTALQAPTLEPTVPVTLEPTTPVQGAEQMPVRLGRRQRGYFHRRLRFR